MFLVKLFILILNLACLPCCLPQITILVPPCTLFKKKNYILTILAKDLMFIDKNKYAKNQELWSQ